MLKISICNTKRLLKVPGMANTQEYSRLFAFVIALQQGSGNQEMFQYFWEEMGQLWSEDTLDNLFKLLAKKELSDYVQFLFRSRTTQTIFEAMSYQYKFSFIEHILQAKQDLLEEINQVLLYADEDLQENQVDPEEYLFEKKAVVDHFFIKVYEELS